MLLRYVTTDHDHLPEEIDTAGSRVNTLSNALAWIVETIKQHLMTAFVSRAKRPKPPAVSGSFN